jgi:hypothetical protein
LHRDEFQVGYGKAGIPLPAILTKRGNELTLLLDASAINSCKTLEDLQQLILKVLAQWQ